jgi:hypothetical protein
MDLNLTLQCSDCTFPPKSVLSSKLVLGLFLTPLFSCVNELAQLVQALFVRMPN